MVIKCSKSFAGIYKSWLALKVMHDYVVRIIDYRVTWKMTTTFEFWASGSSTLATSAAVKADFTLPARANQVRFGTNEHANYFFWKTKWIRRYFFEISGDVRETPNRRRCNTYSDIRSKKKIPKKKVCVDIF